MKKLFASLLLAFSVLAFSAAGTSSSFIIPISDEFYSTTYTLYSLLGETIPSSSIPWSGSEAEMILSRIEEKAKRDGRTEKIWNTLSSTLSSYALGREKSDGFSYDISLTVSPEIYLHSNGDDYYNDNDWYLSYEDRAKLLNLTLEFGVKDFFYTYSELSFGKSRWSRSGTEFYSHETDFPNGIGAIVPSYEKAKELYRKDHGLSSTDPLPEEWDLEYRYSPDVVKSSVPYSSLYSDNTPFWNFWDIAANFPTRAFVSFGGENWNVLFGRERMNWGRSIIGNFTIDSHVGYHDALRLSVYTDSFKYEWNNLFLETAPYVSEEDKMGPDDIRIMMNHRLEFRPISWLDFTLSESIMYRSGVLEIQMLNPAFIYHQLNNRDLFNSLAALEVNATPITGLDLYFQFGLDNGTIPGEGNSQANALGFLFGSSYATLLGKGILKVTAEGAETTPMMYRRDGIDFLMLQRDYTFIYLHSGTIKLNYIGFPYGSDATVAKAQVEYEIPSILYSLFGVEWVRKGEIDMFHTHNSSSDNSDKANLMGSTPWGNTERHQVTLFMEGKYYIPSSFFSSISLNGSLAYRTRWNIEKASGAKTGKGDDLQFSFGFSMEF